jgi:hypothetical protein
MVVEALVPGAMESAEAPNAAVQPVGTLAWRLNVDAA